MPELTSIALVEAWRRLETGRKRVLTGDWVRINLCCGSAKDFARRRRMCWIGRFQCSLPKRPCRPIHRNMLPGEPVDTNTAALVAPPLPV
eukprot:4207430-Alexandrium_andersonii.AAC.1